jgi:hypothetical protein
MCCSHLSDGSGGGVLNLDLDIRDSLACGLAPRLLLPMVQGEKVISLLLEFKQKTTAAIKSRRFCLNCSRQKSFIAQINQLNLRFIALSTCS